MRGILKDVEDRPEKDDEHSSTNDDLGAMTVALPTRKQNIFHQMEL